MLEDLISRPTQDVVKVIANLDGDLLFLGIAGKIGPSLARMAKRACAEAGIKKQIYGISRFTNQNQKKELEEEGFKIIKGDLLDPAFIHRLPKVKNVFFLAGMKFGSEDNLAMTWAINSYLPALVGEQFKDSRLVVFSTGCVYPLVPASSGGSLETDKTGPVGEYAQSCLGRERMFAYGSQKYQTPVVLIRLNYAVEMRYGVLVDIALKVKYGQPLDLSMGYFNVIWQGDANAMVIQSIEKCNAPPMILNITGPETISVRDVALKFATIFKKEVNFKGMEAQTALLSNATASHILFGKPQVAVDQMINWIGGWINDGKGLLDKPTHFEVRDGKY